MRQIKRRHDRQSEEYGGERQRLLRIVAPAGLALAALICLLVFQANSVRRTQQSVYETLQDSAQEQARALRISFGGHFDTLSAYVSTLDPARLGTTEDQLASMGRVVKATDFSRVMLVNHLGTSFTSQGMRSDVRAECFFSEAMAGKNVIEKCGGDNVDPAPHFVLAVPMYAKGRVVGVVAGTYSEQAFREMIVAEAFNAAGYSLICDKDGQIISGSNKSVRTEGSSLFDSLADTAIFSGSLAQCREAFLSGSSGIIGYQDGGSKKYAAYLPIGVNDWMIFNVVPGMAVDKTVADAMRSGILLTGVIMSIAFAFMAYIFLTNRRQQAIINDERMRLRLSDERFRIALAGTTVSIWEYDFKTRSVLGGDGDGLHSNLGAEAADVPNSLVASGAIHPDSVEPLLAMYDRLFAGAESAEGLFRMRSPQGGEWRYMRIRYASLFDEHGKPFRAVGMSEDVTERQQAKLAYERELKLQQAMDPGMLITALFDVTSKKTIRKWFADEREAVSLKDNDLTTFTTYTVERILDAGNQPPGWESQITPEMLMQRYAAGQTEMVYVYLRRMPDGTELWVEDESHLLLDPDSGHLMMFTRIRDIDKAHRSRLALLRAVDSDSMTGLLNHEAAFKRIRTELNEQPEGVVHALFVMDIDNFKEINDTFGHLAGDDTIKQVARLIRGVFRESDVVGRIGGDEFIALMKNVGGAAAVRRKAQELTEALQFNCRCGELTMDVTASVGVCVCQTAGTQLDAVYYDADAALYEAKATGKNRFVLHNGDNTESGEPQNIGGVSSSVQLRALLAHIDGGVVMAEVGDELRIAYVSPSMYRMVGIDRDAVGASEQELMLRVLPTDRLALEKAARRAVLEGEKINRTYRVGGADGGVTAWRHVSGERLPDQPDGIPRVIGVITDVTELKRAEQALARGGRPTLRGAAAHTEQTLQATLERLVDVEYEYIALIDTQTTVVTLLVSGAETSLPVPESGMPYETLHARMVDTFIVDTEREDSRISFELDVIKNALKTLAAYTCIYSVVDMDGAQRRMKWRFTHLDDTKRTIVLTRSDITDAFLAEVAPVTGIFNRYKLAVQIREMLDTHPDVRFALIRGDLDNFKVFNDIYGVEAGDRLLQSAAEFLRQMYYRYPMMLYGHVEADHFMCCLPADALDKAPTVPEIVAWLSARNPEFAYTPRIGVYSIDDTSIDVSLMSDRAYLALKSIKGKYGKQVAYYSENMRRKLLVEQEIVSQMHSALETGQFDIYLQPQFDYVTGEMTGAETLARWRHPEKGVLAPGEFISVFEHNGFITQLDKYIWERACALLASWRDRGEPLIPLSVNVSRVDIYDHSVLTVLEDLMQKYALEPKLLRLEITESAYMENPEQLVGVVDKLRAMGFAVEMDDFGSGYSSLNMLNDVQVDTLKLDMKFLAKEKDRIRSSNIVNSIVRMMRWLRLPVIAEGIESAEQAEYMKSIGCARMQGYYFGRPMPVATFERVKAGASLAPIERLVRMDAETEKLYKNASALAAELFERAAHGALIVEYSDGNIEALRINDRFLGISGLLDRSNTPWALHMQDLLPAGSRQKAIDMLEEAIATQDVAYCEMDSGRLADGSSIRLACTARLIMRQQSRCVLFISVESLGEEGVNQPVS